MMKGAPCSRGNCTSLKTSSKTHTSSEVRGSAPGGVWGSAPTLLASSVNGSGAGYNSSPSTNPAQRVRCSTDLSRLGGSRKGPHGSAFINLALCETLRPALRTLHRIAEAKANEGLAPDPIHDIQPSNRDPGTQSTGPGIATNDKESASPRPDHASTSRRQGFAYAPEKYRTTPVALAMCPATA